MRWKAHTIQLQTSTQHYVMPQCGCSLQEVVGCSLQAERGSRGEPEGRHHHHCLRARRLPSLYTGDVGRWRYTSPFHRGISGTAMLPYVCTRYRQSVFPPAGRAWLSRAPRPRVGRATSGTHRAGRSRGTDEHARALLPRAGVSSGVQRQSLRRTPIDRKETNMSKIGN